MTHHDQQTVELSETLKSFISEATQKALNIIAVKHCETFVKMDAEQLKGALQVIKNAMMEVMPQELEDLREAIVTVPESLDMALKAFVGSLAVAAHKALVKEGLVK